MWDVFLFSFLFSFVVAGSSVKVENEIHPGFTSHMMNLPVFALVSVRYIVNDPIHT